MSLQLKKKSYFSRIILNSNNKMKRMWEIINEDKGRIKRDKGVHSIKVDKNLIMNQNKIANDFNKYFLFIADSFTSNNIYIYIHTQAQIHPIQWITY
jgi:hypothetical protein